LFLVGPIRIKNFFGVVPTFGVPVGDALRSH
jgi:hypothetical protein